MVPGCGPIKQTHVLPVKLGSNPNRSPKNVCQSNTSGPGALKDPSNPEQNHSPTYKAPPPHSSLPDHRGQKVGTFLTNGLPRTPRSFCQRRTLTRRRDSLEMAPLETSGPQKEAWSVWMRHGTLMNVVTVRRSKEGQKKTCRWEQNHTPDLGRVGGQRALKYTKPSRSQE